MTDFNLLCSSLDIFLHKIIKDLNYNMFFFKVDVVAQLLLLPLHFSVQKLWWSGTTATPPLTFSCTKSSKISTTISSSSRLMWWHNYCYPLYILVYKKVDGVAQHHYSLDVFMYKIIKICIIMGGEMIIINAKIQRSPWHQNAWLV